MTRFFPSIAVKGISRFSFFLSYDIIEVKTLWFSFLSLVRVSVPSLFGNLFMKNLFKLN